MRRRSLSPLFVAFFVLMGLIVAAGGAAPAAASHGTFPDTDGIYRIPYADGTGVRVTRDHHDHTPEDRIDMTGGEGAVIVAAASGWIRGIVDRHGNSPNAGDGMDINGDPQDDSLEHACGNNPPENTVVGGCVAYNNYVWIEHPNGEWSKYTHFGTGTVTANGWSVGDWIEAGETLGLENDVGQASSSGTRAFHLHHEVAVPFNQPLQWRQNGGLFLTGTATNLAPIVCGIPNNLYTSGDNLTAAPCDHEPPTADADGPYVVAEGTPLVLNGSGSNDPEGNPLTYEWSPDTNLNDASLESPTFLAGDNGVTNLTLRVYDQIEALRDSDSTTVTVNNVAPTIVLDPAQDMDIDEGDTLTVTAEFTDPGFDDTHTATIDWGVPAGYPGNETAPASINVTDPGDPGPISGTVTGSFQYGENGFFTVIVTVTDDDGASNSTAFSLTVDNVAPNVTIAPAQVTTIDEGETVTVTAAFSDPGYADTHTATIDWGVSLGHEGIEISPATLVVTDPGDPGPITGTVTGTYRYGDNGAFTIEVSVTDDDGGTGSKNFELTVSNVAPTAVINESGTILINGMPTFLANAGDPLDFSADSNDPGSDDLTVTWDWKDSSSDTTTYLNDPAFDPDPAESPEVNPRMVTDERTHTFDDACFYLIDFTSVDDDGATAVDEAKVLIVGNADEVRSAGYWAHQYRQNGKTDFNIAELECYLAIVDFVSQVFEATTIDDAIDVLRTNGSSSIDELFDQQLLAAWLNFANGAYDLDELVDTDGDGVADTAFHEVLVNAEAVRLDPDRTRQDLFPVKDVLERLNNP